jgi:hypothetical protein
MSEPKTSTFTIHHDCCKPETWTARDILAFADFVRTGSMKYAAALSRLGVQIVLSEHHIPKGGTLEEIGWVVPNDPEPLVYADLREAVDAAGDGDISDLCRAYRGTPEYVVKIPIGDGAGNFEGYEYEHKPTLAEAETFVASLLEPEQASSGSTEGVAR